MRKLCQFQLKCPKISPPQSFTLFSKSCEIPKRELIDEKMKCLIFYYIVHGGNLVPQTQVTCNSKLQIIKFSFVLSAHPKRWGTPNSKVHLLNCKELEYDPHINENGLTRTIPLQWVYFQILCLIPLNSLICSGLQIFHT